MRINLKIHKNYDEDLLSMLINRLSVTWAMKTVLYHYARGERVRLLIPECRDCDFSRRKRYTNVHFDLTDPVSVEFLRTQIRPGQRSAFLKYLLRDSLVMQQYGYCFTEQARREHETEYLQAVGRENDPSVIVYEAAPKKKRDYVTEIIKPAGGSGSNSRENISTLPMTEKTAASEAGTGITASDHEALQPGSRHKHNRFGSVEDLSLAAQPEEVKKASGIGSPDSASAFPQENADDDYKEEAVTESDFTDLDADETEVPETGPDPQDDDFDTTDDFFAKIDALRGSE